MLELEKQELILKILPVLDNFELAEKDFNDKLKKEQDTEGLKQIRKQLQEFLKTHGVEEINVLNKEFDPNTTEAVEEIEKQDAQSGFVLEVIQKGYQINDKILRPARVKISK